MTTREDTFEFYLHDIHDLPLLTLEDEQRLVVRLREGRQAAERLAADSHLDPAERAALDQVVVDGEAARDHLIAAHLRL
ncbi:MAG TPA: sigma-70 factor domain-containing protein, partial [Herpetosiphonaceae bacterium]|nr:sigma-70 factor domain-containing protein [Herpetosiphonaceae bacterium]